MLDVSISIPCCAILAVPKTSQIIEPPIEPAEITATLPPATSVLFVGQSLQDTQNWSAFVDVTNYQTDAPNAVVDSVNVTSTGDAATPASPFLDGQINSFAIFVSDTAGNTQSFSVEPRIIHHSAPTAGTIAPYAALVGAGPHQIDFGAAFVGSGLTYHVSDPFSSIAGTVLTLADQPYDKVVTVTAANSGGSVTADLHVTIHAGAAPNQISTAIFGIETDANDGATFVTAPDGLYDDGRLSVANNKLTKVSNAQLTEKSVMVGATLVSLVPGRSCANAAEFQAFLGDTSAALPVLAYPRIILTGDITGMDAYGWNNRLKNLPDNFEVTGAYGNVPDLFPVLDTFVIQTSGVVATAPKTVGLRFRHIHFYKAQNLALENRFEVPKEYLLRNITDVEGLDVQNCRFSSNQLSAIDGGRYITQMNGVQLGSNAVDSVIKHNTFENLTYGVIMGGDGLMLTHNQIANMWADWIIAQGGTRRLFAMWNHFQTPAGDGAYVHGDMLQIQTQGNADSVDGIILLGNTFTPGDYQSKAYSQAEAKYFVNDRLVFSTNKSTVIQDADLALVSPVDQGFKITVANTTVDRFLSLPDATTNAGFTTVLRATGTGRLVFDLALGNTIEGGMTALEGATKDQIGLYSDGTSVWKILPAGLRQNNVPRGDGHMLNALDNAMLTVVDASLGNAVISLPAVTTEYTRFLVKKADASNNTVTLQTSNGQTTIDIETGTVATSRVINHPGAGILFFREAGETVWQTEDTTITLQGLFGNPHANPVSEIRNVWALANIMMPLSSLGLALESVSSDSYYFHNTLARYIPEEINGDGIVGRAEGWLNGPSGSIVLRDNMASAFNFTAGSVNVGRGATDLRAFENYAIDSGSGSFVSTTEVLAEQARLLSGTTEADFRPVSRPDMLSSLAVTEPGIAHIGAHAVADFGTELLTLPPLAPRDVFPVQGAPAVPLDSILSMRLNYPVTLQAGSVVLRDVTDNTVVAASVETKLTDVTISPTSLLLDGHTYRVEILQGGLENTFASLDDPTFGPLPIAPTAPFASIGGSDWTFIADATAFANALTTYDPSGGKVDERILNSHGMFLNQSVRIDNNFDPTYQTGDLPANVVFRSRVTGTTGTATMRLFTVGTTDGQTVSADLATGNISSDAVTAIEGADFGANVVPNGLEIWIKATGTNLSRYYLELASTGSTLGLHWSESVLIPANLIASPFVAPKGAWV